MAHIDVYLEIGKQRTCAVAREWPGWCRVARDHDAALQALLDYASRYGSVLRAGHVAFHAPAGMADLHVVDQIQGDTSTDFGVPAIVPASDDHPLQAYELQHLLKILDVCWHALDQAAQAAVGKTLSKGPRGGGRDLDKLVAHALDAHASYLRRLPWSFKKEATSDRSAWIGQLQAATRTALTAAAHSELPDHGPRGGAIWPPRYFVRRAAWHLLDHAWEIEDRVE